MTMNIKINDKQPIYLQIISHIKKEIIAGNIKLGETIPSRRELADMIKVNPNTVQRAYKEMEIMGLITTMRNSQSEITLNKDLLNDIKTQYIEEKFEEFIESMKSINMEKKKVLEIIDKKY
ncbi:GntR family transcriptional regulator [Hathewaya histolytica]|uniref:GntR family transcriptional regulator n=2 Tax=Hathewaya histolytica TaxID=1498 RepID=A0A4U9RFK5_HATHI|nr:GntR family transcriptional regulator [Hathewaya histolytica]